MLKTAVLGFDESKSSDEAQVTPEAASLQINHQLQIERFYPTKRAEGGRRPIGLERMLRATQPALRCLTVTTLPLPPASSWASRSAHACSAALRSSK